MLEQASFTISIVGLASTDFSVLKVATTLLEKSGIKTTLLERGDPSGTLVLVDVDTSIGSDFYNQFDYPRNRIMLLLSSETINDQRNLILKKPIRVQTLKDTLYDLYVNFYPKVRVSETIPAQKNISTTPIDLQDTTFFILWKAKQEKQAVQIFCSPYSPLFVEGGRGIIATSASREILKKIIQSPPNRLRSTKLSTADFDVLARGQLILPMTNVVWSAALYGSHGQLLPEHSPEIPVQLKAWPNFSRLDFEPVHMRLASFMAARAMTLKQVEERSQVPYTTIVGFYNAAYAIDLVVINPINLPVTLSKKVPSSNKESIFTRIANRLKIAS